MPIIRENHVVHILRSGTLKFSCMKINDKVIWILLGKETSQNDNSSPLNLISEDRIWKTNMLLNMFISSKIVISL